MSHKRMAEKRATSSYEIRFLGLEGWLSGLRGLGFLVEGPGLVPSTHPAAHIVIQFLGF